MIGVFGGTFDPIHFGHLRPALDVVEALNLDKCHFIPCSIPHHRSMPSANSAQRLAMVAAAIEADPRFIIDPVEINREGTSYTIDTLESMSYGHNGADKKQTLCLIIGIDAFVKLDQWHRWQDILGLCHVVVTHRPGWEIDKLNSSQISTEIADTISKNRVLDKQELNKNQFGKILFQEVTQLDISATKIRSLLAAKKPIQYLVPDNVISIIKSQNIYVK